MSERTSVASDRALLTSMPSNELSVRTILLSVSFLLRPSGQHWCSVVCF